MSRLSGGWHGIKRSFALLWILAWTAGLTEAKALAAKEQPGLGRGVISAVYDGDTLRIRFPAGEERKVRLIGVDSPELQDSREKVRFMAFMARKFADLRLYGKPVRLGYEQEREDRYGRLLAYISTEDGDLFNDTLIREGYASAFLGFPFRKDYQERFKEAEREARREGRGLWKPEPYAVIPAGEAESRAGALTSVRFLCTGVARARGFLILDAPGRIFQAVIPEERREEFPSPDSFAGKIVVATGIIELYRGIPQIMLFVPLQVRLEG